MCHRSNGANLCVSPSIKDWPCFLSFAPVWLTFMPRGWNLRTEKDRRSLPGHDSEQKAATGPYLRQIDAYHRPNFAICPRFSSLIDGFLHSLKIGEFLSQSVFRAKLFVRKISIGSSIQAQGTGEFMRRKWRIYGISYRLRESRR
jgi:hypothetical protein